jgi:hypothetical protein
MWKMSEEINEDKIFFLSYLLPKPESHWPNILLILPRTFKVVGQSQVFYITVFKNTPSWSLEVFRVSSKL